MLIVMKKILIPVLFAFFALLESSCSLILLDNEFEIGKINYSTTEVTTNSAVIKGDIKWTNDEYSVSQSTLILTYQASEEPISYFSNGNKKMTQRINNDLKFKFTLTNLEPNTTYYYNVRIEGKGLGGSVGKMQSFKTK